MRAGCFLVLCWMSASSALAQTDRADPGRPLVRPPRDLPAARDRLHVETILGAERHFVSFSAADPDTGRAAGFGARFWSSGADVCPLAVVRPWLDLGGCLGVHVGLNGPRDEELDWMIADQSLILMGRIMLRALARPVPWLRVGADVMYRSFVAGGRESALEAGLRVGFEVPTMERVPIFVEVAWRAQLFATRSDSTYPFPDDTGSPGVLVATDQVQFFSLGFTLGTYWRVQ